MAAKSPELIALERIAASLEELVKVNKKVLKEMRVDPATPAKPPVRLFR
nr:hypothetical protein [uncultured Brevundimonas sp.]